MSKILKCADLFEGCTAQVRADSEDEVLRQAAEHAREVHGLQQIDDATAAKVKGAIRDA
jgi:predicted small metal-binding protein